MAKLLSMKNILNYLQTVEYHWSLLSRTPYVTFAAINCCSF